MYLNTILHKINQEIKKCQNCYRKKSKVIDDNICDIYKDGGMGPMKVSNSRANASELLEDPEKYFLISESSSG